MSKPNSGHFSGTSGHIISQKLISTNEKKSDIIKPKVNGLDLREHPTKYKQPGAKKRKMLSEKERNRTLSKSEYKLKYWFSRFSKRKAKGIDEFWKEERRRIKAGEPTTRNWAASQIQEILDKKRPTYKGKPMQSHHTYSAAKYPHLADRKELIFPVTHHEHLYGYHGGNYKNSLPGKPIKNIIDF